jgi:tRNA-2-methylthio-N6-dimethylallyladenosine synthase
MDWIWNAIRHPITPVRRSSAVSAYIDVIFGCNFNCTYCAVPSARGREVSRRPSEVLDEVRQLRDLGYREITLLGQTVNAYGHDLGKLDDDTRLDFAWLLEQINRIDDSLRVRYTSPHPMYFNDRLIDVIAHTPSICEHLHMPLQSGDNDCLKRMKRTYTVEKYQGIVEKVRERVPNVAITTDLIVGFCGETEAEFANTVQTVRDIGFDNAYMFAYSPRHSTTAWDWPDDVPAATKSRRLNELINLQRESAVIKIGWKLAKVWRCWSKDAAPEKNRGCRVARAATNWSRSKVTWKARRPVPWWKCVPRVVSCGVSAASW